MSRRRTNRVAEFVAVVVAYLAAIAAAFAPASPTGRPLVDSLLLAVFVGVVVYAGASAPWWVTVVAAGAAMAASVEPVLVGIAALGLGVGLYVGLRRRNTPEWRAISVGISMNVLAWAQLEGFFGLSSIIAIAVGVLVFVLGMRRRPKRIRRVAWVGAGAIAVFAVLAGGAFAISARGARADLLDGEDQAEQAIDLLNDGEFALAADRFEASAASLRRAEERLASPWGAASSVLPVIAQHRALAVGVSEAGSETTARIASALRLIDPDRLRVEQGTIDLRALSALAEPFAEIDEALDTLAGAVDRARSPWLVAEASDRLDSLGSRIAENAPRLDNARAAVALAPRMLGGEGRRTYLVLFTTPAEARGLGGFVGNYALLTIDAGHIEMANFGRVNDLEQQAEQIGVRINGPEEFLANYGQFGFTGDVGDAAFRNLTMTPNFPAVGEVASQLYAQITGTSVDGVIALDPFVLQALLQYTDGIQLTSLPYLLTAENAADFLLRDQYALATDAPTRVDALEEAAQLTFDLLLDGGTLPDPAALGRQLGPLAEDRRLLVWSANPEEQDLLRRVGLLGEIPPHDSADGWAFTVNNAAGNKIDSYLERGASYESTTDPQTGQTTGTLRVELTNTAPPNGLPSYVIGNAVGLPNGSSRLYVSFYSSLLLTAATSDGEPLAMSPGREANWNVYTCYVDLAAGATKSFELHFAGQLDRPQDVVTWTQPLSLPVESLN